MLKDFIASNAWTWPLLAYLATGFLNFIVWFPTSEGWDEFNRDYPKLAAAVRIMRAYGMHVRKQVR